MIGLQTLLFTTILAAEGGDSAPSSGPEAFGIGAVVLLVAVAAVLGWMAYLFVNSRRSPKAFPEETPQNLQPYLSDDELENNKTTRVLRAALFAAALLAILLPWYAFNEPDRQAAAADDLSEFNIEEGEHWYTAFSCVNCHGADLSGGGATFTEARSGVTVLWAVPSLNDVLFRYSEEEVRTWIDFGRAGTPMPANGLVGGGAMTFQEIDQVMAYITANQISQADAVAKIDPSVTQAVKRIENGAVTTQTFIDIQQAQINDVKLAKQKLAETGTLPGDIEDLFSADGTCTEQSAELVNATCASPGQDSDRDGLTDAIEPTLTDYAATALTSLPELQLDGTYQPNSAFDVSFDPNEAFTNTKAGGIAVPDLEAANELLETLNADVLIITVTAEREADFLADLESGQSFLFASQELQLWGVDFAETAQAMNDQQAAEQVIADSDVTRDAVVFIDVTEEMAQRAIGLFNANCARCHTGGYSAGTPFETGHGTGAWGPSLTGGRSQLQFPNRVDQIDFVIDGSEFGKAYGINGLGTGRMPGFGRILSLDDIELIVLYERSL